MDRLFAVGGCAYRLQVHAQHSGHVAQLAMGSALAPASARGTLRFATTFYWHTSNLAVGRAYWLRTMIAQRQLAAAVSMDADTWFLDARAMHRGITSVLDDGAWAMGILPVRMASMPTPNLCNLRKEDAAAPGGLAFLDWDELAATTAIAAGGFGVVVFNLTWFREHWPLPDVEHTAGVTGEDIEFCLAVRRRGGAIRLVNVPTHHAEFIA